MISRDPAKKHKNKSKKSNLIQLHFVDNVLPPKTLKIINKTFSVILLI